MGRPFTADTCAAVVESANLDDLDMTAYPCFALPVTRLMVIVPRESRVEELLFSFVYTFDDFDDDLPFQPSTTGPKYSPRAVPAVLTSCKVAPVALLTLADRSVTFWVDLVIRCDASVWPLADTSSTVRFRPPLTVVLTE